MIISERMLKFAGEYLTEATKEKFVVYRLGSNPEELANRNAGDAEGLSHFMSGGETYPDSMKITKYEITSFKPIPSYSSNYKYFTKAYKSILKHSPDPEGEPVGVLYTPNGGRYFSFPLGGAWDYKVLKTLSIGEINKKVEKLTSNKNFWKKMKYSPQDRYENEMRLARKNTWAKPPEKIEPFTRIDEEDLSEEDRALLIKEIFK